MLGALGYRETGALGTGLFDAVPLAPAGRQRRPRAKDERRRIDPDSPFAKLAALRRAPGGAR